MNGLELKNRPWVKLLAGNWHLVGVMAIVLVVAAYKATTAGPAVAAISANVPVTANTPPREGPARQLAQQRASLTPADVAKSTIQKHLESLNANPDGEEAPAILNAVANLYLQRLEDYGAAAGYYERLISEHPDWPGIHNTYIQLLTCYDRMGEQEKRQDVLRRMTEVFPPDSQEYQYAASLLW
jgi:tetratricopeptide (TPR) repeat protein